jgi:hypothetical protein
MYAKAFEVADLLSTMQGSQLEWKDDKFECHYE